MEGYRIEGFRRRNPVYTNQEYGRTGEEPAGHGRPPEPDLLLSAGRRSQLSPSSARANAEWPRETLGWDRAKDILAKAMLVAIPMLLAPLIVICVLVLIGILALSAKALAIAAAVTALIVLAMSICLAVRFLSEPPIVDFSVVQQEPSLPIYEDRDSRLIDSLTLALREPTEPTAPTEPTGSSARTGSTRPVAPLPNAPTETDCMPAACFPPPVSLPRSSPSAVQPVDQIAPQLPTLTEPTSDAVHSRNGTRPQTGPHGRSRRPPPVLTNVDDRPPSTVLKEAQKRAASKVRPSQNSNTTQPKPAFKTDDSLPLDGYAQIGEWRN